MPHAQPRNWATIGSFVFLAAQAPWLLFCWVALGYESPANWLAGLTWLLIADAGACFLSLQGSILGLAAAKRDSLGVVALLFNAAVFAGTGISLLMFFGPLR